MLSHNYKTRLNSLSSVEESTPTEVSASNYTIVDTPSQTNANTTQFSETGTLIINLEKKMTSRFDGLDNELLNLEDVSIKNLQVENERLRKKVNVLENKILTLESEHNSLEQYGRRNNIEITGISDSVPDQILEEKVVDILNEITVNVPPKDIEACYRVGASKNSSKKTIVRFINRKHAKKALLSRKNLRKSSLPDCNVFVNENLTVKNSEITFLGRKLKRNGHLNKIYTRDGTVHISSPEIHSGKVLKIHHINDLFNLFPYYDFGRIIGKMFKMILYNPVIDSFCK